MKKYEDLTYEDVKPLLDKKDRLMRVCSYVRSAENIRKASGELADLRNEFTLKGEFDHMIDCYQAAERLGVNHPSKYASDRLFIMAGEFYNAAIWKLRKNEDQNAAKWLLELACRCVPNHASAIRALDSMAQASMKYTSSGNYAIAAENALERGDLVTADRCLNFAQSCRDYEKYVGKISNLTNKLEDLKVDMGSA